MKRKPLIWITGFFLLVSIALGSVAAGTIRVDPYFHYHKPLTEEYSYRLNNQRYQNNGIVRHFDYSGLITGTSMTENFKASEAEALWGGTFVKVCYSGGTFKEINDNIEAALRSNPDLKTVIRGLFMSGFTQSKDLMKDSPEMYPTYLYDDDLFNDVHYLFNRDVVFSRVYAMIKAKGDQGFVPGITHFDRYSAWSRLFKYGKNAVTPDGISFQGAGEPVHLSKRLKTRVKENVRQNVTSIAKKYPDVTFFCFLEPFSAVWWMYRLEEGTIYRQVEAERIAIKEILSCPNIRLFSFNCRFELTTDLNHYKDRAHYGEWINSRILHWMYDGENQLTKENYEDYLEEELRFYTTYDYNQLNDQPDYEDDSYASALLEKKTE